MVLCVEGEAVRLLADTGGADPNRTLKFPVIALSIQSRVSI